MASYMAPCVGPATAFAGSSAHRSAFDASTSSMLPPQGLPPPQMLAQAMPLHAIPPPPVATIVTQHFPPHENSDCGSSSGVGGMKHAENMSSDEAGSSSSPVVSDQSAAAQTQTQPTALATAPASLPAPPPPAPPAALPPHPATLLAAQQPPPPLLPGLPPAPFFAAPPPSIYRPGFPPGPPLIPTQVPPPGPPLLLMPQTPPGQIPSVFNSSSDLFVHIQPGERLTLRVGTEEREIGGPATVRMVGEAGANPSALPIYVPPGHQVHQIIDENGMLRHLILSPEPSFAARNQLNGYGRPSTSQIHNLVTVDRPNKSTMHKMPIPPRPQTSEPILIEEQTTSQATMLTPEDGNDFDNEEKDRLREMLNSIQMPSIVRISDVEADLQWQEIDTSEAAAPGGPFPQIDASEFNYSVILYESQANSARFICTYQCDPEQGGNSLRICKLRPLTEYFVQLKASLEERGIIGEPSKPVFFRTKPPRPGPPVPLRLFDAGVTFLSIGWSNALEKNHTVLFYSVYLQLANDPSTRIKVYTGPEDHTIVPNLHPGTRYDVFVSVTTDCGESVFSSPLRAETRIEIIKPPCPMIHTITARSIKVGWMPMPEYRLLVELSEVRHENIRVVKDNPPGTSVIIDGLLPATEYKIRFNIFGTAVYSDWTFARTLIAPRAPPRYTEEPRVLIPQQPFVLSMHGNHRIEIGWRVVGARDREFLYHLEGAPRTASDARPRWRTLYKGEKPQNFVVDEEVVMFRVQTINKKNMMSDWSPSLVLPNPIDELPPPPALELPELTVIDKNTILVQWVPCTLKDTPLPEGVSWIVELRRKDDNNNVVYSGQNTNFRISGLSAQKKVEVQVRKVLIDTVSRVEGEWSAVASICTPRAPPLPPHDLRVNPENKTLEWSSNEDDLTVFNVTRYRVISGVREKELEINTKKRECSLGDLEPATIYEFTVLASHEGGLSEATSPVAFETSATAPEPIETISIESLSVSEISMNWSRPDCCGSEIKSYIIKIYLDNEEIRELTVSSTEEQIEHVLQDLEAATKYEVSIAAQNEIGVGEEVYVTCRTQCYPPIPPILEADCEPTSIRLRWHYEGSAPSSPYPLRYRVVRVLETSEGQESTAFVYDGENSHFKVKNLSENSIYKFRIRAIEKEAGPGEWSSTYTYQTTFSAPHPIKGNITIGSSGSGFVQIEWSQSINKVNPKKLFYCLETLERGTTEWITAYEGNLNSYMLRLSDYVQSVQVRVRIARVDANGKKLLSPPSASQFVYNTRKTTKQDTEESVESPTKMQRFRKWIEESKYPTGIMLFFTVLFLGVVILLANWFYAITSSPQHEKPSSKDDTAL